MFKVNWPFDFWEIESSDEKGGLLRCCSVFTKPRSDREIIDWKLLASAMSLLANHGCLRYSIYNLRAWNVKLLPWILAYKKSRENNSNTNSWAIYFFFSTTLLYAFRHLRFWLRFLSNTFLVFSHSLLCITFVFYDNKPSIVLLSVVFTHVLFLTHFSISLFDLCASIEVSEMNCDLFHVFHDRRISTLLLQ